MSMPQILSTLDPQMILGDRTGPSRSWAATIPLCNLSTGR
jgi:hypothetical protein